MKFNKKQLAYLDKLVEETPTRMMLAQVLFNDYKVEETVAKLGQVWETQWSDIDRYVSDRFIEVHGAKLNTYEYY